jgi:hypothetical protein
LNVRNKHAHSSQAFNAGIRQEFIPALRAGSIKVSRESLSAGEPSSLSASFRLLFLFIAFGVLN